MPHTGRVGNAECKRQNAEGGLQRVKPEKGIYQSFCPDFCILPSYFFSSGVGVASRGSTVVVWRAPKFEGDGGGLYGPTGGMKCVFATSQKNNPCTAATAAITHTATGVRRHHEDRRTGSVFTDSGGRWPLRR